jgi:hypothetical protein
MEVHQVIYSVGHIKKKKKSVEAVDIAEKVALDEDSEKKKKKKINAEVTSNEEENKCRRKP